MLLPFWDNFLEKYATTVPGNDVFLSILKQAQPVSLTEDELTLKCGNQGAKIYLDRKKNDLERLMLVHGGNNVKVNIILELKEKKTEAPLLNFQPSLDDLFVRAGLHLKYRFENFAVSTSNQVAFAAAQAVASNPGTSYNPLFLYGGVGVGKTHLAQAIARQILERNPDAKALFAPGDHFINEHIESIRERTTARFRRKYRFLNIIIIDDVQFIAGKRSVQEEFFHMFNSIVSSGGQVVLTSDRPPSDIKDLEDRLRSRFSGGLIVDIQQPDFELRTAILLIKAREKSIEIDIEAAKIIAERIEDTRALEGALLSIYARILGVQDRIDLEVVDRFFSEKLTRTIHKTSPGDIIKIVCSFYNIKHSQIKAATRAESVALARQIIMYLIRKELGLNYLDIAHLLKRKDHTTIMHGEEKINRLIIKDAGFKSEIDRIIQTLHSST